MLFQTGGGCRASNYISLLRKALDQRGLRLCAGHFLQPSRGWRSTPASRSALSDVSTVWSYAVLYGDLLMTLVNQTQAL